MKPNTTSRFKSRHFSGVLLCVLVVVFAFAAKLAWYHPHQAAGKSIASMKALTNPVSTQMVDSAKTTVPVVSLVLAMLLVFFFVRRELAAPVRQVARVQSPQRRRHYARPPPVR